MTSWDIATPTSLTTGVAKTARIDNVFQGRNYNMVMPV